MSKNNSDIKQPIILGIQDSHDASASIMRGEKILCAISEERIQRIKSMGGYPKGAIEACLNYCNLKYKDIDFIALAGTRSVPVNLISTYSTFSKNDYLLIQEKIRYPKFYENTNVPMKDVFKNYLPKGKVHYSLNQIPLKESWELSNVEKENIHKYRISFISENTGVAKDKIFLIDHHMSHAYYAYYASPFRGKKVASLTMDAGGDGLYETINIFNQKGEFQKIYGDHECLIGPLYSYITLLLGMRPFEHEYKVMGLSPYSSLYESKKTFDFLCQFQELNGIQFKKTDFVKDLFWQPKNYLKSERFDGIAGGLQKFTEFFLDKWFKSAMKETHSNLFTFSGGVALNVKATKKISEIKDLSGLYIPPGPGDESLSLGASWALIDKLKLNTIKKSVKPLNNGYLGNEFSEKDINIFRSNKLVKKLFKEILEDPDDFAVKLLIRGKIVAICRGRMEFGPRALGNRSILANPSIPGVVRKINESLKNRDFWMPFAPSILSEQMKKYCYVNKLCNYDYMTLACDTKSKKRNEIYAGIHAHDFTARPQKVNKHSSPQYYRLLKKFYNKTGIGGLLNTSLNYHGKPIVMKPIDIVNELISNEKVKLDAIIIGKYCFKLKKI